MCRLFLLYIHCIACLVRRGKEERKKGECSWYRYIGNSSKTMNKKKGGYPYAKIQGRSFPIKVASSKVSR